MADRSTPTDDRLFNALVCIVNPLPFDPAQSTGAQLDAMGDLDWQGVVDRARRHRVMPLLAHRLTKLNGEVSLASPVPEAIIAMLARETKDAVLAELAMLGELKRIQAKLDDHKIACLVIKGLVQSQRCFGGMGFRTNRDIDLLVAPDAAPECDAILQVLGYRRVEPPPDIEKAALDRWSFRSKDWVYLHNERRVVVELHHRLFDNDHLCDPTVMARATPQDLGGQFSVSALTPDDDLPYLALHGALHAWSRLKWLIDVTILIQAMPQDRFVAMLATQRFRPGYAALIQACGLSNRLFGLEPPATLPLHTFRQRLLQAAALNALTRYGAKEIEATRFGTTVKNASHYLLWTKPSYLLAELRFDLTDMSRDSQPGATGRLQWLKRLRAWIWRHFQSTGKSER